MSTNGSAVMDGLAKAIRKEYASAAAEGREKPGRPALITMLANPPQISGHMVRKAKELVDAEDASEAPANTGEPAQVPDTDSASTVGHQPGEVLVAGDASTSPGPRQADASRPLVLWPYNTHRLAATNEAIAATLEAANTPEPPPAATSTPARAPRPWPLALIGLAAAVAVWSGWVGLGEMAGFGPINLLPGIGTGFTVNTAVVLPISVEAYAAYALRVWLSTSRHSARTIQFAKTSTITSLVVGGLAQVVYHLLAAAGWGEAPWPVTMLVSLVPVLVLGLASALAKLVANDRQAGTSL